MADKRPDLLKYFVNIEDAHKYSIGSGFKVELKCPICGNQRKMDIHSLTTQGFSCNKCGDHVSYPEKFIMSFLNQAEILYQYQLSKKDFKWCGKYRYDFYLLNDNCIVEVNGSQHYNKEFTCKNAKTLDEIKEIDKIKEELAFKNGIIHYININCKKSNLETIKNGIIESGICDILNIDISKIDFVQCAIDANRNIMRDVCDFYNNNPNMTPPKIAPYFNVNRATILDYLKRGKELGLCNYDVEKAKQEAHMIAGKAAQKKLSKRLAAYDSENNFLGEFKNAKYTAEYFKENFDIKLNPNNIQDVCTGRYKHHKGYIFKYLD